ncbi:MAG TPA: SCP2 sterol-binding domain-containing protein [Candidatus Limnocylindrales bacterium]|nr:SCP2 sterol-binding domain-containing protein [Candidatus Limnocylindrales bacterium]
MVEAKTPKQFLEEILPSKFKPDKAANIDAIAGLDLTGPNGGTWVITIRNRTLNVTKGTHPSPSLTLTIADNDFMDLVNGKLSTVKAFFNGKIRLSGNFSLALKLKDAGLLDFGT